VNYRIFVVTNGGIHFAFTSIYVRNVGYTRNEAARVLSPDYVGGAESQFQKFILLILDRESRFCVLDLFFSYSDTNHDLFR
jgi:hypothetical protein